MLYNGHRPIWFVNGQTQPTTNNASELVTHRNFYISNTNQTVFGKYLSLIYQGVWGDAVKKLYVFLVLFCFLGITFSPGVVRGSQIIKYAIDKDKVLYVKESQHYVIIKGKQEAVEKRYGLKPYQPKSNLEKILIDSIQARGADLYPVRENLDEVLRNTKDFPVYRTYYDARVEEKSLKSIETYLFSVGNYVRLMIDDQDKNVQKKFDALLLSLDLKAVQNEIDDPVKIVQLKSGSRQNVFEVAESIRQLPYIIFSYPLINNPRIRNFPGVTKGKAQMTESKLLVEQPVK